MSTTVLLCAHGSPDPRAEQELLQLTARLQRHLPHLVRCATLEFGPTDLTGQISQILTQRATDRLIVVPLFMSPGVHACEDVPRSLGEVQALWPQLTVISTSVWGTCPQLPQLLAEQTPTENPIVLFAHGSRRSTALVALHGLTEAVQTQYAQPVALVCYQPDPAALERQLSQFETPGIVVPLFLFSGGLVDWATILAHQKGWLITEPLGCSESMIPLLKQFITPWLSPL